MRYLIILSTFFLLSCNGISSKSDTFDTLEEVHYPFPTVQPLGWLYKLHEPEVRNGSSYLTAELCNTGFIKLASDTSTLVYLIITIQENLPYKEIHFKLISHGHFISPFGHDISMKFDDGQFFITPCYKAIHGDDGTEPFVRQDYRDKIYRGIQKSKTMYVQAEFESEGVHSFEFNVEGFKYK